MDKKYNGFNNGRDRSDGVGGREVNHGKQETMTKYYLNDEIEGELVELDSIEDAVKYIKDNYKEDNEIHPDFHSFPIFQKVAEVVAVIENDICTEVKIKNND